MDTLTAIQGRLSRLQTQINCIHNYEQTDRLIACRKCLAYMVLCVECDNATFEGKCDWCEK